jgi:hypothetical protein
MCVDVVLIVDIEVPLFLHYHLLLSAAKVITANTIVAWRTSDATDMTAIIRCARR